MKRTRLFKFCFFSFAVFFHISKAQNIPKFVQTFNTNHGLSSNNVNDILQDDNGSLWIATNNGLNRHDGTAITKYFHSAGSNSLPHSNVHCIKKIDSGYLAVGTEKGLSFLNPQTGNFENFYYRNGNGTDKFNNDIIMLEFDQDHQLWAGSKNCIYMFDNSRRLRTIIRSSISLTNPHTTASGFVKHIFPLTNGKVLLDLFNGWKIFEPASNKLVQIENNGSINFDFLKSPKQSNTKAPFFKVMETALFFIILIAIASLFYALYRFRFKQLRSTEEIRAEISRNLHDEVGATLTNISLGSLLAQKQLNNNNQVQKLLDRIYQDSRNVSETMREIIWSINPKIDTVGEAFPQMLRYATEILEAKDIELKVEMEPEIEEVKLAMLERRDLYLIFKEAMNNLAKHSNAKQARISFQLLDKILTMCIVDDGIGYDISAPSISNGLKNMKARAEMHQWKIQFNSIKGKGTSIKVTARIA